MIYRGVQAEVARMKDSFWESGSCRFSSDVDVGGIRQKNVLMERFRQSQSTQIH